MAARWLAISSVVVTSSVAAADPVVLLDQCTAFDRTALHAAIQRELAASQVKHDVTLVVACPDAVTAHLSIEPEMGLARTLDLGEVPGDLRVKLLAVAAVELVVVADPAKAQGPASERPAEAPPLVAPAVEPAPPGMKAVDRIAERDVPAPRRRLALTPRIGVRMFTSRTSPMPHLAIDAEIDRLAFGAIATRGTDVQDPLGTLTPYLFAVAGSYQLGCWGDVELACMRARLEMGVAGVSARSYTPMVTASDASAFYAQAALSLDIEHSFGAVAVIAVADAGWSEGLVATVQDREPVRLAGFTITTVLGVRWRP